MRTKLIIRLILLGSILFLSGCVDETDYPDIEGGRNMLSLNFQIDGVGEIQTYAPPAAEKHECRIDEVYTLFFRADDHSTTPNQYVGYTRTGISSSTATGSTRVTLPEGEDANDEWQLIFLANFEANAFLDGEADVDAFLTNKVANMAYEDALKKLKGCFNKDTGMGAPLPMTSSFVKPASTNLAAITFTRRVARIDLSNSAANFILETAQVWNARIYAPLFKEGGDYAGGTGDTHFKNYDKQVAGATSGVIQAKLYAFPNLVTVTNMQDKQTTCLIIGGKYNGSSTTTYYRVNVSPKAGQQFIKANGAYTINITKVTGEGEVDPGDAYDKDQGKIDYIINEWDDSFLGVYVFDEHGNGLAVSQRNIIFDELANQTADIEVYTIKSSTNPISGSWDVKPLEGPDKDEFTKEKLTVPADTYIRFGTRNDNKTTQSKNATAVVTWGTIEIPVTLKQLDTGSLLSGVRAIPNYLWFPRVEDNSPIPDPNQMLKKEVKIDLSGNFLGIDENDIRVDVIYTDPHNPNPKWVKTPQFVGWVGSGIALYEISVDPMADQSMIYREADIKFTVIQNPSLMTCKVRVRQSHIDPEKENQIHQVSLYCFRQKDDKSGYDNLQDPETAYTTKFKGFPADKSGKMDLQFSLNNKDYLKYKLQITTTKKWWLTAHGNAQTRLEFVDENGDPKMGGTGTGQVEWVWIKAKTDDFSPGWSNADITLEYEDGENPLYFSAHQEGVMATLPNYYDYANTATVITDGSTYYYGTKIIAGRVWLDRNIGAVTNEHYDNALGINDDKDGDDYGKVLDYSKGPAACPDGYRIPKSTSEDGLEWDLWEADGRYDENDYDGKKGYYIRDGNITGQRWYLPCRSRATTAAVTAYLADPIHLVLGAGYAHVSGSASGLYKLPGSITSRDASFRTWVSIPAGRFITRIFDDESLTTYQSNIGVSTADISMGSTGATGHARFFVRCIKKADGEP